MLFELHVLSAGENHSLTGQPREFLPISRLVLELEQIRDVTADYATFSGVGDFWRLPETGGY